MGIKDGRGEEKVEGKGRKAEKEVGKVDVKGK